MRTRIYGSLMNCEVEEYLKHNGPHADTTIPGR